MGNSSSELQQSPSEDECKSSPTIPSKPPPTLPPETLMAKPWRKLPKYGKELEEEAKRDITNRKIVEKTKVLVFGHVGAGKSSFINSCLSVSKGRKCMLAATGCTARSLTTKFRNYDDYLLLKSVAIADCIGIEDNVGAGLNEDDVVNLLKGHIKEGYKFNPKIPIKEDDKFYIENPKYTDKVHCVVFVLSARVVYDSVPTNIEKQMKRVQQDILEEGISRILVLTKADLLCEEVQEDASNIYRSVKVDMVIKNASKMFSIPTDSIYPVVNFENDIVLSTEKSIPILLALRQIIENAHDRVNEKGTDTH